RLPRPRGAPVRGRRARLGIQHPLAGPGAGDRSGGGATGMKTARESTGIASLASQSVVYGFGGVLARALGVVLVPIYLHAAGRSAFGTVELMLAAVLFASILLRMGIVVSMSRFTIGETEQREWAPIVHTIFTYVMVAATAGVVIGFLLRGPIGDVLEVSDDIVYAGLFGLWITMNYDVMARVYRID